MLRISSAERVLRCPGSVRASAGMPETTSAIAESGTRTHEGISHILKGDEWEGENSREAYIANAFARMVAEVEKPLGKPMMTVEESAMYIGKHWSGHPDRWTMWPDVIHLWEYKTGYKHQLEAREHVQGRGYVAGLALRYEQPIVLHVLSAGEDNGEWHSDASFDESAKDAALGEMMVIYMDGMSPDAPRKAGEHCRYCPARGTHRCPETVETMSLMVTDWRDEIMADPAKLSHAAKVCEQVKPILDHVKGLLKDALESGIDVPGWQLGGGRVNKVIADPLGAWAALSEVLDQEQFVKACKVSRSDLVKAVIAKTYKGKGGPTKKEIEAGVNQMLASVIVEKPTAKWPVQIKEKGE